MFVKISSTVKKDHFKVNSLILIIRYAQFRSNTIFPQILPYKKDLHHLLNITAPPCNRHRPRSSQQPCAFQIIISYRPRIHSLPSTRLRSV